MGLKGREAWLKREDFTLSYLCPYAQGKAPFTQPKSSFWWNFTLIVARYYGHVDVFILSFFVNIETKTKARNFTKHRKETSLL